MVSSTSSYHATKYFKSLFIVSLIVGWEFAISNGFSLSTFKVEPFTCRGKTVLHQMTNDEVNRENELDKSLRIFFSDYSPFSVARSVLDVFMVKSSERCSESEYIHPNFPSNPLLLKKWSSCREGDDDAKVSHLFSSLFEVNLDENPFGDDSDSVQRQQRKRKGQSFKVFIAYRGSSYCGWQIQPNNEMMSVQQSLIHSLQELVSNPIDQSTTSSNNSVVKPIDIRVCGRTDAGVSALSQVCRVRTLKPPTEVGPKDIQEAINGSTDAEKPSLWCTTVERVDDKFHPTFDAACRAYAYLIDANDFFKVLRAQSGCTMISYEELVCRLDIMLRELEGLSLDYFPFSFGKVKTETTICTLLRARASLVELNEVQDQTNENSNQAILIELVGDRFLRRMVRILVATALREVMKSTVHTGSGLGELDVTWERSLLDLAQSGRREDTAKAAPPDGLIFVGASFL
jgi:tRNA pseudouridine(38-40) synthase